MFAVPSGFARSGGVVEYSPRAGADQPVWRGAVLGLETSHGFEHILVVHRLVGARLVPEPRAAF